MSCSTTSQLDHYLRAAEALLPNFRDVKPSAPQIVINAILFPELNEHFTMLDKPGFNSFFIDGPGVNWVQTILTQCHKPSREAEAILTIALGLASFVREEVLEVKV